ncbi:erythroid differentiation-related factor 1-like, partial [Saccoglossus kowalevskii]|uniref:Erythroid differentiation-related factor 1-like n=1 Tax=Saccoglossus kowalevskii TaxID=10224 RepID=A0ABM0LZ66_SACKO
GLQAIDSDVESNPLLSGNSPCAIEFPTTSKDDSGSSAALEKETAVVNQPEMTVARRRLSPGSWQGQMKISLFKKARAVFYVMGNIDFEWASSWSLDAAGFLATSIRCYEFSVELLCDDKENADCIINITRRLANSRNELGKLYMKQAAIIYYQAALSCIGEKPSHIRESVCWELSSTYFTIATLLQDNAPLAVMAQEQVERDINDLMMKALKYCDVNQSSPQYPIVRYRAATIHHRLASMHHNSYRNQVNEQKRKQGKSLTELHYGKAIKLFQELDRPSELLRVLLERVAMSEHQFN